MAMQCDDEYERYLTECVETGQYDEENFVDPSHCLEVLKVLIRTRLTLEPDRDTEGDAAYTEYFSPAALHRFMCAGMDQSSEATSAVTNTKRWLERLHSVYHDNSERADLLLRCKNAYTLLCARATAGTEYAMLAQALIDDCYADPRFVIGSHEQKAHVVIEVRNRLVQVLSRKRFRRRGERLVRAVRNSDGRQTYCFAIVKHPLHPDEDYTIGAFVEYECSAQQNPDLNELVQGHVIGGDIKQITEALQRQPFATFPDVRPYRHAWAFEDGVYIGFMHDQGEFGGSDYAPLWSAVDAGVVDCLCNFRRACGVDASLPGFLHVSEKGGRIIGDLFLTYDQASTMLPHNFVASKFIRHRAQNAMGVGTIPSRDWDTIATPIMTYVMSCQWGDPGISAADRRQREARLRKVERCEDLDKHARDVQRVFLALLGRAFFPVDAPSTSTGRPELDSRLDSWHAAIVMMGMAGTGKSSSGMLLREYMDATEVASLTNAGEQVFGLQAIYNKRLVLGLEVKRNFSLDTAVMQQMISGETVSVARKNRDPINDRNWSVPMILAMNELPTAWDDAKGALARRLLHFNFGFRIPARAEAPIKINGDMHTAIHKSTECAALLRKMFAAYLLFADEFGGQANLVTDIEEDPLHRPQASFDGEPLPKGMRVWIHANQGEMNFTRAFLLNEERLVKRAKGECSEELQRRGIDADQAVAAWNVVFHTPFPDLMYDARAFVREHTGDHDSNKITSKGMEQAIDNTPSAGFTYIDFESGPARVLNRRSQDGGDVGELAVTVSAPCKYASGVALRSTLHTAAQRLANIGAAAGMADDDMTAAIRAMIEWLTTDGSGGADPADDPAAVVAGGMPP